MEFMHSSILLFAIMRIFYQLYSNGIPPQIYGRLIGTLNRSRTIEGPLISVNQHLSVVHFIKLIIDNIVFHYHLLV